MYINNVIDLEIMREVNSDCDRPLVADLDDSEDYFNMRFWAEPRLLAIATCNTCSALTYWGSAAVATFVRSFTSVKL
jgi:hypothetical protein